MTIKEIITRVEEFAPLPYAEDFDNVGLLVGDASRICSGVLVTLDTLEQVVDEAIEKKCNLILSFHPIIFKGLKSLTGKDYVQRTVLKAIKHDIAIYAIHTALDNQIHGVNAGMADQLGLTGRRILLPQRGTLKKLTTYVPVEKAENLRSALFNAGAGHIGNYSHCSFNVNGTGTYMGNEDSNPQYGEKGRLHEEGEVKIGVIFPRHLQGKLLNALFTNHPYEEVAYEIISLDNEHQEIGMGLLGELSEPVSELAFLEKVKSIFQTGCVRHSDFRNSPVKKVAVLGGSGAFAIDAAKKSGADAFITADLKYHDFFRAEGHLLLADPGHYESEQFTKNLLVEYLRKKIPNFAIVLSVCNTNPVKYF